MNNPVPGALDLGTTSSRFILFDAAGRIVAMDQKEHRQIRPKPGSVAYDPLEIWGNTQAVTTGALAKAGLGGRDIVAVGRTDQRETAMIWNRKA